jgi:DNA ligase-associated metallophosphoesterase
MEVQIGQETYQLLSEKAVLRTTDKTLFLADLHLGKAQHFRKNGISIPEISALKDYERLNRLIQQHQPQRLILLGDLFHSTYNYEWNLFCNFVDANKQIELLLVLGNHDILEKQHYKNLCLTVIEDVLEEGDLIMSHHPLKEVPMDRVNFAGHIHPGIVLYGKGKQRLQLPCFYLFKNQLILPAFGSLTGLQLMEAGTGNKIYVIGKDNVLEI